jgi:hypothetical protein
MEDAESPTWTLADHLEAGRAAVEAILGDGELGSLPQPVCHHFGEVDPVDEMKESREAAYAGLEAAFAPLGLEFHTSILEAWETVVPTVEWLNRRVPPLLVLADQCGLTYEGWTWEPRRRQPIGASTVQVFNAGSATRDEAGRRRGRSGVPA